MDVPSRFSLLHATFRAGLDAVAVRDEWIQRAASPERVEQVFACDTDDEISMSCSEIASGVVGEPMPGRVTAVRNWNAAAAVATGDLMVVIADDLHPPDRWDAALEALRRDLDPRRAGFVIKVSDSADPSNDLMRHPVLSRAYYERFGLWYPEYEGYLVDNDFTLAAHRRNVIIDGRAVRFEHRHPLHGGVKTESHQLIEVTRAAGRELLGRRWPMWKRRMVRWPLRPRNQQTTIGPLERAARGGVARLGYAGALVPDAARVRLRTWTRGSAPA